VPVYFEGGAPGSDADPDSFSVVVSSGSSFSFLRDNSAYTFQSTTIQAKNEIALGGPDESGNYAWNLAQVKSVSNYSGYQRAVLQLLLPQSTPASGSAILVNSTMFHFADDT